MGKNKEMRQLALMYRMKQLFNIIPRVCQSAARIKPWTHPFTVQHAAMSPTRPLHKNLVEYMHISTACEPQRCFHGALRYSNGTSKY